MCPKIRWSKIQIFENLEVQKDHTLGHPNYYNPHVYMSMNVGIRADNEITLLNRDEPKHGHVFRKYFAS